METTPRIMVAGARGFVGCRAMEHFHSAIAVDSALLRNPGRALQAFVRAYQPNVILNAAAISDIGVCEKDPEGSSGSGRNWGQADLFQFRSGIYRLHSGRPLQRKSSSSRTREPICSP